ncbi:MAG: HhH-GPD family protein [Candidatus Taylorbacteria bacterium]|nr:HhH-GPD family protein [Candidatus Taylorbacteria bacterium]
MSKKLSEFNKEIWNYYRKYRRDFPWRISDANAARVTPYHIVVSEIMLQQTQAPRVVPRYEKFMKKFPDWKALARATNAEVIGEWQGLGYNRRALYLKRIAETVTSTDNGASASETAAGEIPKTYDELYELPGIGPNTAGSVLAFAWNLPHPFIETNIRSVFIHFFFKNRGKKNKKGEAAKKVSDAEILELVAAALALPRNQQNPRDWYYALMDYGVHLKSTQPNPSRRSAHHIKQSTFKGSNRELRAQLLRFILKQPATTAELIARFKAKDHEYCTPENIERNILALEKEGFIQRNPTGVYSIKQ